MRDAPEARYATTPDGASIAYQLAGSGSPDVLYLPGIPTQLNAFWDFPVYFYAQYLERLASFSRLLVFDTRGSGLSDPLPPEGIPLAMQVTDLLALVDAAGLGQVSVLAELNAGPVAIRLAADHPERVRSLVLNMTYARRSGDVDYPGPEPSEVEAIVDMLVEHWGTGVILRLWTPDLAEDPSLVKEAAHFERLAGSPARVRQLFDVWTANDARADLARVLVPTLVMHDSDNPLVPTEQGRYLAAHIPDAKYVEYPPSSEMPLAEQMLLMVTLQCEFLTGTRARAGKTASWACSSSSMWSGRPSERMRAVTSNGGPTSRRFGESRPESSCGLLDVWSIRGATTSSSSARHRLRPSRWRGRCVLVRPSSASRCARACTSPRWKTPVTTCWGSASTSPRVCAGSRPPARSGSPRPCDWLPSAVRIASSPAVPMS